MNIEIVKAKPEDAEGIFNVQKTSWLETYLNDQYHVTSKDIYDKFQNRDERLNRWNEMIDQPDQKTWVAKDGDQVIGFASGHKLDGYSALGVYVLAKYQRQGIGQKLMDEVLNWLGEDKPIKFECVAYNTKAINFYKKNGFEINESIKTKGSKLPSGAIIPTVEMVKIYE